MEEMIKLCTQPTVLTQLIHSIYKPAHNVIIKKQSQNYTKKKKHTHKDDYYNTQLSYIHLAQLLGHVRRHTIYKELETMKCQLSFPQSSTSCCHIAGF